MITQEQISIVNYFNEQLDNLIQDADNKSAQEGGPGFTNQEIVWCLTKKIHEYMRS